MFDFSQVSVAAISFILSWYLTYNWTILDRRIHVSLFYCTVGRLVASWVKSTAVGSPARVCIFHHRPFCRSYLWQKIQVWWWRIFSSSAFLSVVPLAEDAGVMMTHLFIIGLFVSRTSDRRCRCDDDASFHHRPFCQSYLWQKIQVWWWRIFSSSAFCQS